MTATDELLHLIQQNYWRSQYWQHFSHQQFIWLDEACAIAFESYVSKQEDYAAGPMKENIGMLTNSPLLNFNDAEKSQNDDLFHRFYGLLTLVMRICKRFYVGSSHYCDRRK
jgi:hypothetical protein